MQGLAQQKVAQSQAPAQKQGRARREFSTSAGRQPRKKSKGFG